MVAEPLDAGNLAERSRRCAFHPEVEHVAVCRHCGHALCDECFRHVVDDAPWCDACVDALSRNRQARVATAVSFTLVGWGLVFWASRFGRSHGLGDTIFDLGAIAAPMIGLWIGWPRKSERSVREREAGERFESVGPASPYRARLRRVARAALPPLSERGTVLAVAISMAVAAVLLPVGLKLPHWMESEIVLAAWWGVLALTLAFLLHRGTGLVDDYQYRLPRAFHLKAGAGGGSDAQRAGAHDRVRKRKRRQSKRKKTKFGWSDLLNPLNWMDAGEGFVVIAVVAVALLAAFAIAWLFVELLLPLVFVVVYFLLGSALSRAVADPHDCRGHAGRAVFWGALWSAIYVAPLGVLVLGVHAVLRWKHGG